MKIPRCAGSGEGEKPFGPTIFFWQRVLNDLYSRGPQGSDPRPPPLPLREGRQEEIILNEEITPLHPTAEYASPLAKTYQI